jgi:hypothetical protein
LGLGEGLGQLEVGRTPANAGSRCEAAPRMGWAKDPSSAGGGGWADADLRLATAGRVGGGLREQGSPREPAVHEDFRESLHFTSRECTCAGLISSEGLRRLWSYC